MLQYCGNGILSYYMSLVLENAGITNAAVKLAITASNSVWGLIVAIIFASVAEKIGRRPAFFTCLIGMFFTYLLMTIFSWKVAEANFSSTKYGGLVVFCIFLFPFFYHVATPIGPTYANEIMPNILRARGSSAYNISQLVTGIIGTYSNSVAMDRLGWKFYPFYVRAPACIG